MPLARRTSLVIAIVLVALAAVAGAVYFRYRVNQAVAGCETLAPPDKPATAPPNLPGFAAGEACGPGGTGKPSTTAPSDTKR